MAGGSAKVAIVMLLAGISAETAQRCIDKAHGSVRHSLEVAEAEKQKKSVGNIDYE
jgi:N-acetylmuramic acid 6-phosphate (MurNAc-6-P) etherase